MIKDTLHLINNTIFYLFDDSQVCYPYLERKYPYRESFNQQKANLLYKNDKEFGLVEGIHHAFSSQP